MSASNVSATSIARSERQSVLLFIALFVFMVLFVLILLGYMYYNNQKNLMLSNMRLELQLQSERFIPKLRQRHINFDKNQTYPKATSFHSAIYDSDKKPIFSTLRHPEVSLDDIIVLKGNYIHYISQPESYYLGAKYVVFEVEDSALWKQNVYKNLLIFGFLGLGVFSLLGFILIKLFLRPMRNAVLLLDTFIKDTTHELNTPISAILNTVQTIDSSTLDEKNLRRIRRIDIAARTISTLYDDLTYITLNHKLIVNDTDISIDGLLYERLEYFELAIKQKRLTLTTHIKPWHTLIDKARATRMIDNLLSNAIKYNTPNGSIDVSLMPQRLCITNSGKTIPKEKLHDIFNRYVRAESTAGGFGLGLHIVAIIAKTYNITIDITSTLQQGTRVCLQWHE